MDEAKAETVGNFVGLIVRLDDDDAVFVVVITKGEFVGDAYVGNPVGLFVSYTNGDSNTIKSRFGCHDVILLYDPYDFDVSTWR